MKNLSHMEFSDFNQLEEMEIIKLIRFHFAKKEETLQGALERLTDIDKMKLK